MDNYQLNNVDELEIISVLEQIEHSFQIHFEEQDLSQAGTFGQFCDVVIHKIPHSDAGGCTSQQAFYKLRNALLSLQPEARIIPQSPLKAFVPVRNRKEVVAHLEGQLGF